MWVGGRGGVDEGKRQTYRQTETERKTEKQTERETERERQTNRGEKDRERQRQTERQRGRDLEREYTTSHHPMKITKVQLIHADADGRERVKAQRQCNEGQLKLSKCLDSAQVPVKEVMCSTFWISLQMALQNIIIDRDLFSLLSTYFMFCNPNHLFLSCYVCGAFCFSAAAKKKNNKK